MAEKKERISNFELLRIISILMIIMWHVIVHGHYFDIASDSSIFIKNVITAIIIFHVNSFIFLTGYFSNRKDKIESRKCFRLLGNAWFYKAVIVLVVIAFKIEDVTNIKLMEELLPLDVNSYWFMNHYIILYIISPYLNKVIDKMNEKEYQKFLAVLLLLFSIIPFISQGRFISNSGYTITQFIIMYFFGAYFSRFPILNNFHFKNMNQKRIRILLLFVFFACAFLNLSIYYLGEKMQLLNNGLFTYLGSILQYSFVYYSNPILIIQACAYCLFFETLSFKSKIINYISSTVFGIYLIHDNFFVREHLYEYLISKDRVMGIEFLLKYIAIVFLIFIVGFLVESIRKLLVKIIKTIYRSLKRQKVKGN